MNLAASGKKIDTKRKLVVVGDGVYVLLDLDRPSRPLIARQRHPCSGGCGKTCLLIVYAEKRFPEVCFTFESLLTSA